MEGTDCVGALLRQIVQPMKTFLRDEAPRKRRRIFQPVLVRARAFGSGVHGVSPCRSYCRCKMRSILFRMRCSSVSHPLATLIRSHSSRASSASSSRCREEHVGHKSGSPLVSNLIPSPLQSVHVTGSLGAASAARIFAIRCGCTPGNPLRKSRCFIASRMSVIFIIPHFKRMEGRERIELSIPAKERL